MSNKTMSVGGTPDRLGEFFLATPSDEITLRQETEEAVIFSAKLEQYADETDDSLSAAWRKSFHPKPATTSLEDKLNSPKCQQEMQDLGRAIADAMQIPRAMLGYGPTLEEKVREALGEKRST